PEVALDDVEIGPAATARVHANPHLARTRFGIGALERRERPRRDRRRGRQLLHAHQTAFTMSRDDEGGLALDRGTTGRDSSAEQVDVDLVLAAVVVLAG